VNKSASIDGGIQKVLIVVREEETTTKKLENRVSEEREREREREREMFFFFFGGVNQEVRKEIHKGFAVCPRCDSPADLVEYDNVFRAFFIPLWRWSGDNPAIACESCGFLMPMSQFQTLQEAALKRFKPPAPPPAAAGRRQQDWTPTAPMLRCWSCASPVDPSFRFCPQCGTSQN
jgi:Zn finger protein HypA/HybF involved in hydrogenase expression